MEQLAEITVLAAEEMRRFGLTPKAALPSHANFGSSNQPSAVKMREALDRVRSLAPWLEVDGEMHRDAALVFACRGRAHERYQGVVRRPKNLDSAAAIQLLAGFALITSALKDRRP